jgi:hypothetical protein
MTATATNDVNLTSRCTGAGYVFGFFTSFASFKLFGFPSSLALVCPPGDLGRSAGILRHELE